MAAGLQEEAQIIVRQNSLPIQCDSAPQRPLGLSAPVHLIEDQPVVKVRARILLVFFQQFLTAVSSLFPGAPVGVAPDSTESIQGRWFGIVRSPMSFRDACAG